MRMIVRLLTATMICTGTSGAIAAPKTPTKPEQAAPDAVSPFFDVEKYRRGNGFEGAPAPENGLNESASIELTNCDFQGTYEELTGVIKHDRRRLCFRGFQQTLPKTTYDVLGLSASTSLDGLSDLTCYSSDDDIDRIGFNGPAQIGALRIKCVGIRQNAKVRFEPLLRISRNQRKLMISQADISVCGPEHLIQGGATYTALVNKYGNPVSVQLDKFSGVPGEIGSIRFFSGSTAITVRSAPAEFSGLFNMGCASVLRFSVDESRYDALFVNQLQQSAADRESAVPSKF